MTVQMKAEATGIFRRLVNWLFPVKANWYTRMIILTALGCCLGCNDLSGLTGKQHLPSGIPDPNSYNTRAGALALYQNVVATFQSFANDTTTTVGNVGFSGGGGVIEEYILTSGLLTDELTSGNLGGASGNYTGGLYNNLVDARQLPEGIGQSVTDPLYTDINGIRNSANIAIGALAAYDSVDSPALRGHLYALQGYSILFLADLYCSGVPLSTLDFHGDFTYHVGLTTAQLYQSAVAKFDTAISLSGDSARILNLARVGKGRAWLAIGQYDSAEVVVSDVPQEFSYQFLVNWHPGVAPGGLFATFASLPTGGVTVVDREGNNGLPYLLSGDPRSASSIWGGNTYGMPQYAPVKYGGANPGVAPVIVASGIEVQLIRAEVALHDGDITTWLNLLNTLRTDGTTTPVPPDTLIDTLGVTGCSATLKCGTSPGGNDPTMGRPNGWFVPAGYTLAAIDTSYPAPAAVKTYCSNYSWYKPCYVGDSLVAYVYVLPAHTRYNAGTGGVVGLPPLSDPGTADARIALMFQERAYWLFLTGHRQGDLRRMIRDYGFPGETVYPTGGYPLFDVLPQYGTDVTAPVPAQERANPLFTGCFSRGA